MQLASINNSQNIKYNKTFGHYSFSKNDYSTKQKAIVGTTTALGVATSLACLAKGAGYSLKPSKMLKNIKNSYFWKTKFEAEQVIPIGVGTCLGGLAGGYLIDKNSENRKAKRREAVMQIGNISIPILTVAGCNKLCKKLSKKENKVAESLASIAGIFVGVYLANFLMNKLSNTLFNNKDERGVKLVDFSAHLDDVMLGAQYAFPKSKIVHAISRAVPPALILPGFEVGTKKAGDNHHH